MVLGSVKMGIVTIQTVSVESEASSPIPAETCTSLSRHVDGVRVGCHMLLWAAVFAYTIYFCAVTFQRHDRLHTTLYDMGIFDQAVWLISRGHSAFLTTRGMHVLSDHFTPILYLLAPLYWIWDSPKVLLTAQSLSLALAAIPLFHIALHRLHSPVLALIIAVTYLLYPPMQWMNIFDFHTESFAPLLVLSMFWFLVRSQHRSCCIMAILLLLCKETMGLVVACIGIHALFRGERKFGSALILLGVVGLVGGMLVMRAFNHGQPSQYISLYASYGDSAPSIARYMLTHPARIIAQLTSQLNLKYLVGLLAPVGFLVLLTPEYIALALPTFLANMLSDRPQMHTTTYQYNATILPFLFIGVAHVEQVLEKWRRALSLRWRNACHIGVGVLLIVACAHAVAGGPLSSGSDTRQTSQSAAKRAGILGRALAVIPAQASVSAQTAIGAQLAHRRRLYMFPNPFQTAAWGNDPIALRHQLGLSFYALAPPALHARIAHADVEYVVLGPGDTSIFPLHGPEFQYEVRILLEDNHYGAIFAEGDILILKRGADFHAGRLIEEAVPGKLTFLRSGKAR